MEKILITGCSGFIGMHLTKSLLKDKYDILGIDNINDFYSVNLKNARLNELKLYKNFDFVKLDIANKSRLKKIFEKFNPHKVVNLAAQAGVGYSLVNPHAYVESNVIGFLNILEMCKDYKVKGLIYASSSSVYGKNKKIPFSILDRVEEPISIYAATKKSNELMAHVYNHIYGLRSTGLRFFSVYGPWGRPDMAIYIFTEKILRNETISVFNHGNMRRDFTYIDDIVEGIKTSIKKNYSNKIFNLGNNKAESLMDIISLIEKSLGKKARVNFKGMQPGDVKETLSDIEESRIKLDFYPKISIKEGMASFIEWYKSYHNI